MFDCLSFIDSPIQIMVVLLIALVVFGPKRLPEIGKQIGSALRELRKATNDVVKSFNTEDEPEPYTYPEPSTFAENSSYAYSSYDSQTTQADLTDYTIVGLPVHDASNGAEAHSEAVAPASSSAGETDVDTHTTGSAAAETVQQGPVVTPAVGAVARGAAEGSDTVKEGERNA